MTQNAADNEPIILIGPMKAGKTTVGRLLAAWLHRSFSSLDRVERHYTEAFGFDAHLADTIQRTQGDWAWYSYRRQFFAEAVVQFLAEHASGVLELGGGHPILANEIHQARVDHALAPFQHVVLLLPTPDIEASLRILKARQKPAHLNPDWNEAFLHDDRYFRLAKHVIYTEGQTPEATCQEILARMERQPHINHPAAQQRPGSCEEKSADGLAVVRVRLTSRLADTTPIRRQRGIVRAQGELYSRRIAGETDSQFRKMDKTTLLALYDHHQRRAIEYPGVRKEVLPHLVRFIRPAPGANWIAYSRLNADNVEAEVAAQVADLTARRQPFSWKVFDHDPFPELGQHLQAHGLKPDDEHQHLNGVGSRSCSR